MSKNRLRIIMGLIAGIISSLPAVCSAQSVDSTSVAKATTNIVDSTLVNVMPEAMPFAVRSESTQAAVRTDTIVPGDPPLPLTRKERRQMRRARKNAPEELPSQRRESFKVAAGQRQIFLNPDTLSVAALSADSLRVAGADVTRDSLFPAGPLRDSTILYTDVELGDTLMRLSGKVIVPDSADMTARQRRLAQKERDKADSTLYRHNPYFRDTLSVGTVTALSLVVPGFGQFYNQDYWKIPVLYGVVGTTAYLGIKEHQKYKKWKDIYDYRRKYEFPQYMVDPVQTNLIKHNTLKQFYMIAALGTYIYFIGDAAVKYPSENTRINSATLLSTICPGAGQIYNGSYFRVPIVVGGFATFAFVIDWNNRQYERYKLALELRNDNDPDTVDEFPTRSDSDIVSYKDSARRNRDLCIILTAAFYIVNIIDAHVDAHLRDYDVSDDLSSRIRLLPTTENLYTQAKGNTNLFGFTLSYTF